MVIIAQKNGKVKRKWVVFLKLSSDRLLKKRVDKQAQAWYNEDAKLIEYCKMGMTFFMGEVYPFLARVKIEFVKCKFHFACAVIPILQ